MRQFYEPRTLMLRTDEQRERVKRYIDSLPLDQERPLRIVIDDPLPAKSRDQEKRAHAMIGDIARTFVHAGRKWGAEDMKRLLVDQFRRSTINDPDIAGLWHSMGNVEMAPALDGSGVVMLGVQTRKFPARLYSVFIEWLFAFGAEINVQWSEK